MHTCMHTYIHTDMLTCWHTDIQTYRHTDRHTDIHTYRHADMQTCRHADIQTYRHTDIQTSRHPDIQTSRHTDIQTYRHTDIQTDIQTYIHTFTHTYIQTDRHTYRHTYRHTDRQTDRRTDGRTDVPQTHMHIHIYTWWSIDEIHSSRLWQAIGAISQGDLGLLWIVNWTLFLEGHVHLSTLGKTWSRLVKHHEFVTMKQMSSVWIIDCLVKHQGPGLRGMESISKASQIQETSGNVTTYYVWIYWNHEIDCTWYNTCNIM